MKYLAIVIILAISTFLRFKNNALVPIPGESIDEYSNTWVGLSLLQFGVPVGISSDLSGYSSNIKAYVNVDQIYQTRGGDSLTLRTNWFDHPPMAGLITALYTRLRGGQVFEDANTRTIRKPLIIAGIATTLAIFLLGLEVYSFPIAILASVLHTISPTILFGSRPVQSENFFIPLVLFSLYFLLRFFRKEHPVYLIISGFLFGLSTIFKLTSFFFLPVAIFLIITKYKKSSVIPLSYFFVTFAPISLLFLTYGAAVSLPDFIKVFLGNTQRGFAIGPDLFDSLIKLTKIGFRSIPDLWVLLAWLATFIAIPKINSKSSEFPLSIFFFAYLFIFVLLGGNGYSWYYLPFFPITFLFLSKLIIKLFSQRQNYFIIYVFSMAIIGVYFRRLMGQPSPAFINPLWQYLSLATLLIYSSNYLINHPILNKITTLVTYILFLTTIIATFMYGYTMTPASWFQAY